MLPKNSGNPRGWSFMETMGRQRDGPGGPPGEVDRSRKMGPSAVHHGPGQGRGPISGPVSRDRAKRASRRSFRMLSFRAILLGTMVLTLGAFTAVQAAVSYDAIMEWSGP